MLSILNSPLASCFEGFNTDSLSGMDFLDEEESNAVWGVFGDSKARGLYGLSPDSWVNVAAWKCIGRWIDAYNGVDELSNVSSSIRNASGWEADKSLLLVQSRNMIVRLGFSEFEKYWVALFDVFDDGPILLSEDLLLNCVFCFTQIGDILSTHVGTVGSVSSVR